MMSKLLYSTLIFLFIFVLFLVKPAASQGAGKAKFSLSPASASANIGNTFELTIRLNTEGEKINSAAAFLTFPAELLEAEINTTGSFATFFSQKTADNNKGTLKVNGGSSETTSGENLLLANITFKAKKAGKAEVSFTDQSVVYKGTNNILGSSSGGVYTLNTLSSKTTPATKSAVITPKAPTSTETATSSALPKAGVLESTLLIAVLSLGSLFLGLFLKRLSL